MEELIGQEDVAEFATCSEQRPLETPLASETGSE